MNDAKRMILVCCGTGCIANGSLGVYNKFKSKLETLKIDMPVCVFVKPTGCNGLCEKGPLVKIVPDDISYCRVKEEDVEEIINETVVKGNVINRLLFEEHSTGERVRSHKDTSFYKKQLKVALRNIGEIDPASIEDYMERGGYAALRKALFKRKGRILFRRS